MKRIRLAPLCAVALACSSPPRAGEERVSAGAAPLLGKGGEPIAAYVVLRTPGAVESVPPGSSFDDPAVVAEVRLALTRIRIDQAALRAKLEPMGVVVDFELTRLINGLQVRATPHLLAAIEAFPEVARVEPVTTFYPSLQSAIPAVGAPSAWSGMPPATGAGVRVGIIDSGIDYTHADLGGSGDPADHASNDPAIVEPGTFPTARVIGGFDFVGDDYNPASGSASPMPDPDPLDCFNEQAIEVAGGHGTHVTGIAAGNGVLADGTPFYGPYDQSFDPSAFRVAPGVAPEASLFALKIFGCSGGTQALAAALDRAADPDQDGDMSDRLDVVNASLGSAYGLQSGSEATLVQNLNRLGTLLVVAAGNDGASFYAVGSPAVYPEALAVAASADNNFLALSVESPASVAGDYPAAEGGFTVPLTTTGPITGTAVLAQPADACSTLTNASAIAGNIAIIDRGECFFVSKFERAIAAGAIAAVVVDNELSAAPFSMGGGDGNASSIPGVMIRRVHGEAIKDALPGVVISLDGSEKFAGLSGDLYADFSSRGPSAWDGRLKPEIAAPGFSIDSARVGSGTQARRSQGTSMACPMVAGAAALLRQAHPERTPAQVKAMLMNTAVDFSDLEGNPYAVSMVGAGRLDVERAIGQAILARADGPDGEVGVSFGDLVVDEPTSSTRSIVVENLGAEAVTLEVSAALTYPTRGIAVSVSPSTITLPPSGDDTVELRIEVDPLALGAPGPDPVTPEEQFENPRHFLTEAAGHVVFTSDEGAEGARVPFHGAVRAGARRHAGAVGKCGDVVPSGELVIPIEGTSAVPEPVVTAFELGTLSAIDAISNTNPEAALRDLRAVGAASSAATSPTFGDASISFGVAIAGQWQTPAQGQLSLVGIAIDRDLDVEADFVIFAEPLSREGPYADVLAATTYNLNTGQQTASKRYINMVPASEAATYPFENSVIVLSTFAKDIGISEDQPVFRYYAFAQSRTGFPTGEQTNWIEFNAARPTIDTSRAGSVEGRPIFIGDDPVEVFIDTEAAGGGPLPKLLLLHHSNVAGERVDVVDLEAPLTGNLTLSFTPNAAATPDLAELGTLTVSNTGEDEVREVEVSVQVGGATGVTLITDAGNCTAPPDAQCTFDVIEGGDAVTIEVRGFGDKTVLDDQGRYVVVVEAQSAANAGCDLDENDNAVAVAVPLTIPAEPESLSPSGGCACTSATGAERPNTMPWLLAAMALGALRRRRRFDS